MAENQVDLEAIFFAAHRKPPEERAAYLNQVCGNDRALRRRIEQFLSAQADIGSFLESGAPPLMATIDEPITERPGTVIGPYKLLEQIGEGGFGVVFMAEQTQPVRRKVALKILKPGMDTRQVIARFEAERQALAILDHPNIAKVLDGGQTSNGRPYFVMDLVKGIPITEYCDQNQLTARERLELFVHLCQAVQHAHQKGIIHRDLKPSNILVTVHDTTPVVKVIDFGVAKALGQELTDKTLFTGFAQMVGTPLYMSPEQAGQSGLDIDTRSDIYTLGVLLYELLTGTTPFDKARLKELGYDELRRIIREEEPPRPSTRISTLGEAATSVSTQRKSDPKRLSQLCRGELDWIVMKALEKDRNRRYETASALAADVQRYLNDEPVQACPPSAWYRFRKFARRNKRTLATAALLGLLLLVLVGTLAANYVLVSQERDQKEDALRREQQALLLKDQALKQEQQAKERADKNLERAREAGEGFLLVTASDPRLKGADLHSLRKNLLAKAVPFFEELVKQRESDPALAAQQGRAYYKLAFVRTELGEDKQALADYEQARAIFARLAKDLPAGPSDRELLAASHNSIGHLLGRQGRLADADEAYRNALVLLEKLRDQSPNNPRYGIELALVHNNLGHLLAKQGKTAGALEHCRKALDLRVKLAADFPSLPECRRALASGHDSQGLLLKGLGKPAEALKHHHEALAIQDKLVPEFPGLPDYRRDLGLSHHQLGHILVGFHKMADAESHYGHALAIQRKLADDFPSIPAYRQDLGQTLNSLGGLLHESNRDTKAQQAFGQALALQEKLVEQFPKMLEYQFDLGSTYNSLGGHLRTVGKRKDAEAALRKALALHEKLPPEISFSPPLSHALLGATLTNLAMVRMDLKRFTEARRLLEQAIDHQRAALKSYPKDTEYRHSLRTQYWLLALTLVRLEDHAEAAKAAAEPHDFLPNLEDRDWEMPYRMVSILIQCESLAKKDAKLSTKERQAVAQSYAGRGRELLELAISLSENNLQALRNLAWFLADSPDNPFHDPVRAVKLAKSAVERAPVALLWQTLGIAHYRAGNSNEAISALERAVELDKGADCTDGFFLAMAHWRRDDPQAKEKARKWYDQAVTWMGKYNRQQTDENRRYRAEAAQLLGIKDK